MGGGFGGKESQSALFACVAAIAAKQLGRPVKLRLDRDDDFLITGRRHCFHYEYEVGYDDDGRILGAELTMVSRAGFSADLSGPGDDARDLPLRQRLLAARRRDPRLLGQDQHAEQHRVPRLRRPAGRDRDREHPRLDRARARQGPLDVRRVNFYGRAAAGAPGERNVTPYGQVVDDNIVHELVAELEATSGYRARRAAIAAFNATSPVLKRGLALTPVKFGISFNLVHLNQAGALVHVYGDGSVLVNHGGTEMGQGLNTKVAQVVAHELGVDFDAVRVTATDTQKVANTSATAASTGSDLNGKAAQDAARQIRERLAAFARRGGTGVDARASGRASRDGNVAIGTRRTTIRSASSSSSAYLARVQLWSDGFYATPGLHWDRETMQGRPFYYFAYGAAVSEVVVDTLTGEWKLLRADVLHDAGRSLNPAIDIGQVEGGFIQGMGWLTMEELVWHPNDGRRGRAAADARAEHLQDPDRERLPAGVRRAPVRRAATQRRRDDPPQQGDRRAAAAAAVLGLLRDPRRGLGGRRPSRRSAAHRRRRRARRSCARSPPCRRARAR